MSERLIPLAWHAVFQLPRASEEVEERPTMAAAEPAAERAPEPGGSHPAWSAEMYAWNSTTLVRHRGLRRGGGPSLTEQRAR
jgi:hypothetical protein